MQTVYIFIYRFLLHRSLCQRLFNITPEPIPGHIKDKALANQNKEQETPMSTDEATETTD